MFTSHICYIYFFASYGQYYLFLTFVIPGGLQISITKHTYFPLFLASTSPPTIIYKPIFCWVVMLLCMEVRVSCIFFPFCWEEKVGKTCFIHFLGLSLKVCSWRKASMCHMKSLPLFALSSYNKFVVASPIRCVNSSECNYLTDLLPCNENATAHKGNIHSTTNS